MAGTILGAIIGGGKGAAIGATAGAGAGTAAVTAGDRSAATFHAGTDDDPPALAGHGRRGSDSEPSALSPRSPASRQLRPAL